MPFFSIIVPCYNQAHFLPDCINSVLAQEFKDWEVIIVNDGSEDSTQQVAESLSKNESRIKVIQKDNGGLSSARNAGIKVAQGRYYQFLDADDLLMPLCLRTVYEKIHSENSCDIVRVGYCYVNESNTEVLHKVHAHEVRDPIQSILGGNLGPSQSIVINKAVADIIGGFDESLRSAEDWDYWMRAVKAGAKVSSISTILVSYRYVGNSMSRDAFRMYNALKIVTLRGPKKDERIKIDSPLNIDRDMNMTPIIKRQLIACLGVSVMQGKIEQSVRLFQRERSFFKLDFSDGDFSGMYSYLSFRYWNSPLEIARIMTEFYPLYEVFFKQIGLTEDQVRVALRSVFLTVHKINNKLRYGRWLGFLGSRFFKIIK
jgi:glycosyltransferase involved in cell wall biosynthesis